MYFLQQIQLNFRNVITTEKDAVKLVHLLKEPFWIVVLESLQPEFETWLIDSLKDWSIRL